MINVRCFLSEHKSLKQPLYTLRNIKMIKKYIAIKDNNIIIYNKKNWERTFFKFILAQPSEMEVIESFFCSKIQLLNKNVTNDIKGPTLICVEKNNLYRIKKLINHYRKLGIQRFAFLDNDSTDGTIEYLVEQPDVDIFSCLDSYTTNRREGWINRIVDYYGLNKWYLIVDSDELLIYNDCEKHNIQDMIEKLEKKNQKRLRALMIDMYSENSMFSKRDVTYDNLKYFDMNDYHETKLNDFIQVRGGPRGRVFSENPLLTKYPLVYFEKNTCQGKSHFIFPYKYNFVQLNVGLLHYKFLSKDLSKYQQIVSKGNYYNGSIQYKQYINLYKEDNEFSFFNKANSKKYVDSNSIYIIDLLHKVNWNE